MIAIKADLQGIEETVVRPILITAVKDIKKQILGLTQDIYTFYDNKDNLYKRKTKDGGIIGDNSDRGSYIKIEYTEESEDGNELSLVPARPDFKPIYHDKDVGSSFQPIHHSRKGMIHFTLGSKSKSKIYSLANKIRLYSSSDAMYCLHDFEYFYNIPNFLNKLLLEINDKKNYRIIDGDKLAIEQYIDQTFDDRVDFANALDGDITKSSLVIREKQLDIEGWIEGDLQSIKPEYNDQASEWLLEFDYTFTYEKPVTLLVKYPILVYNSIIHPFFRTLIDTKNKKDSRPIRTKRAQPLTDVTQVEQDIDSSLSIKHPGYYVPIPEYDTTILPKPLNFYARMAVILTIMDETDRTLLFNLDDIPTIKLKDSYKDFLINSERLYVGEEFRSVFHFELWKNNKRDYQNKIILQEDGTLRSTYELDYRYTYRVSINILTDLNLLPIAAKNRLKDFVYKQWESNPISNRVNDYKLYWQHVNFQKLKRDLRVKIVQDNILTDWISLLKPDVNILSENLERMHDYFEALMHMSRLGSLTRSVQLSSIETMFEKK